MTRIGAILRYKSSPGARTEAWSRGPLGDATAKVCTRTRFSRCACIPLPGRTPASGAPAPPYAGVPGCGLRLVWHRFCHFCGARTRGKLAETGQDLRSTTL